MNNDKPTEESKYKKRLAHFLIKQMNDRKISMTDLAGLLHFDKSHISNIMNQKKDAISRSMSTIRKYSSLIGHAPVDLIDFICQLEGWSISDLKLENYVPSYLKIFEKCFSNYTESTRQDIIRNFDICSSNDYKKIGKILSILFKLSYLDEKALSIIDNIIINIVNIHYPDLKFDEIVVTNH